MPDNENTNDTGTTGTTSTVTIGWPTSDTYIGDKAPFGGRTLSNGTKYHAGIDMNVAGDALSVANGVVTICNNSCNSDRGRYVKIDHGTIDGQKFETLYQHLASISVKQGDTVSLGQPVGKIGGSGKTQNSYGVHLHFETYRGGQVIDPRYYYPYKLIGKNSAYPSECTEPTQTSPITNQIYSHVKTNIGYQWQLDGSSSSTWTLQGSGYQGSPYAGANGDSGVSYNQAATSNSTTTYSTITSSFFAEDWAESDGTIASFEETNKKKKNFLREYRLMFGIAGEEGYMIGKRDMKSPRPLHISFNISKSDLNTLNNGHISIQNLSENLISVFENWTEVSCALYAGYGENLSLIMNGIVTFCSTTKSGADWTTSIELVDQLSNIKTTSVNLEFDREVSWREIFDEIAFQSGTFVLYSENADVGTTTSGFSYVGNVTSVLQKACESNNLTWSIQNGIIQIKRKGESMNTSVCYLISSKTGMIGSPSMVKDEALTSSDQSGILYGLGYDVKYLMNVALNVADYVKLESKRFDGYFAVSSININGDNESGDWSCSARLYPIVEGGLSQLDVSKLVESGYTISVSNGGYIQANSSSGYSGGSGSSGNYYWYDGPKTFTEEEVIMMAKTMYLEWGCGKDVYVNQNGYGSTTKKGDFTKFITADCIFACGIWTILNGLDHRGHGKSITTIKQILEKGAMCWYAYSPDSPTVINGRDLTVIARDVLNRWAAESNGQTNVGRCLPKEYVLYYGDVMDKYYGKGNPNAYQNCGANMPMPHFMKESDWTTNDPDYTKNLNGISQSWDYSLGDPYQ